MTHHKLALGAVLALALLLAPAAAHAQRPPAVPRIGILLFGSPTTDNLLPALLAGLRDLGYVEGRSLVITYRYAEGRPERLRELAQEAAAAKPDVIVALGGDIAPFAKAATTTIPIVMVVSTDPVEAGLVASVARPGGNLTGVAFVSSETAAKRLQLLKEAAPGLGRVALLWNPDHPDGEFRNTQAAGRTMGVEVQSLEVRTVGDFDTAFRAATRERAEAVIVASSRFMNLNRQRIAEFTGGRRLPLVSGWGPWARTGGFMSYGPDLNHLVRRVAVYVDKILKGARPAELPIEQPSKFQLVVNVKTAKTLGLTLPQSLLLRADQVIE